MVSRHSAFYSPLITTIAGGFLARRGIKADYDILSPGQRSSELIRDGAVDVMQSAVSSNWKPMERGESPLPLHFAQINQRDGFFLVARERDAGRGPNGVREKRAEHEPSPMREPDSAREPVAPREENAAPEPDAASGSDAAFDWRQLGGQTVLADHAAQPLVMLKYAARLNGVEWAQVDAIDAGSPAEMVSAFREGRGDYVHLQSPAAHQLQCEGVGHVVASVGAAMPPVAFSSLCCSREFARNENFLWFLEAYSEAREWVRTTPAAEVARTEANFFMGRSIDSLTAAVKSYQELGCWEGSLEITRDLYEQALNVFEAEGAIARRYPYEEVCLVPL